MKSSGKSTAGQLLAKKLGIDFIDTDILVEQYYFLKTEDKKDYKAIYKKVGKASFHKLEELVITDIMNTNKLCVIATGGSSLLHKKNVQLLLGKSTIIYLKANPDTLKIRWKQCIPGFIDPDNVEQDFDSYHQERITLYKRLADFSVRIDEKNVDTIVNEIDIMVKKLAKMSLYSKNCK